MRLRGRRRREAPRVSVVVPVYDVERWLPASLDSLLAQEDLDLDVVVVDDGSPDDSGEIADAYAARDDRVQVLHVRQRRPRRGSQRGDRQVQRRVPRVPRLRRRATAGRTLATLAGRSRARGSDFVTGSIVRWEADGLHEPPWMRRLHRERGLRASPPDDHPEILGDVFAWNKLFRTSFWRDQGLEWPEGRALRGPAGDHPRLPRRGIRRRTRRRLPLADDAFVVRSVPVPALIVIFGDAGRWPGSARRSRAPELARVTPTARTAGEPHPAGAATADDR